MREEKKVDRGSETDWEVGEESSRGETWSCEYNGETLPENGAWPVVTWGMHRDDVTDWERVHVVRWVLFSGVLSLRQDPLEAILVIFGRRALNFFFVWNSHRKLLEKYKEWHHFCAHAQWWSPWRRKNVENGHLAPSNLTFLFFAIDRNGFRRLKEEGLIYKILPQIF